MRVELRASPDQTNDARIVWHDDDRARSEDRARGDHALVVHRGVELVARQDDAIPDGVVFIPFAFVEAAANLLTNPALDPFGKIPEFKYCAAKVEPVTEATRVAAE